MGTFDLGEVDPDDQFAVERTWNGWVDDLFAVGLRPAEQPTRSGPYWATYRLFPVDEPHYDVDYDIAKLEALL